MPGNEVAVQGVVAEELQCSRSERSSLEVALEPVSRPLSVVEGLEMEEPALSEVARLQFDETCSMNGTPPVETDMMPYSMHTGINHYDKSKKEVAQCVVLSLCII